MFEYAGGRTSTEVDGDVVDAVGMDDGEIMVGSGGVRTESSWRMTELYPKSKFNECCHLKELSIPCLCGLVSLCSSSEDESRAPQSNEGAMSYERTQDTLYTSSLPHNTPLPNNETPDPGHGSSNTDHGSEDHHVLQDAEARPDIRRGRVSMTSAETPISKT